jgi:hypothetical protein
MTHNRLSRHSPQSDAQAVQMWEMLNIANGSDWSPFDSLLLDDQRPNGRAQPDSIVNCPVFTKECYDDDFLLACIGILDEL